jgi:hypothetical protein
LRDDVELRRRAGRQLIADWQAEHGAFSVEEIAAARAEMAAADAEAFDASGLAAALASRTSTTLGAAADVKPGLVVRRV